MGLSNEEVIRRLFDAYARADVAELRALLTEDVEYRLPGRSPMAGTYMGPEAVLALWDRQKAYLGGRPYRVSPIATVSDDEHVVLLAQGEAQREGAILTWRAANVYRVRDGRVRECQIFVDDLYVFDEFWAGMPTAKSQAG